MGISALTVIMEIIVAVFDSCLTLLQSHGL